MANEQPSAVVLRSMCRVLAASCLLMLVCGVVLAAEPQTASPPLEIHRVTTGIVVDGDLSDAAWKEAVPISQRYETNPGDNVEPKEKRGGYLLYDDKFLKPGFEFSDPDPTHILGPYNDRDHVGGNTDDYGGIILDTR